MASLAAQSDVEALLLRPLTASEAGYAVTLLAMASDVVRLWCRQTISYVTGDVATFNGLTQDVELHELPVVNVSQITVNGIVVVSSAYQVAPGGEIQWVRSGAGLTGLFDQTEGYWPWTSGWQRLIAVTYDHGYATVPKDVVAVTAGLVAERLMVAASNPGGLQSRTVGPFSESYGKVVPRPTLALSDDQKDDLNRYRRRVRSVRMHTGMGR